MRFSVPDNAWLISSNVESRLASPEDLYLLRVGYGGLMGAITSIDQEGFASAAFHSFPDFTGYALNAATYLVKDPAFGWQAFGGNTAVAGSRVTVTPLDAFRTRVYIAPAGLWLLFCTRPEIRARDGGGEVGATRPHPPPCV